MKIRLVTVTWGKWFTDIFLRIAARSLLADGNIAALAARHEVGYTIHTTAADAGTMRASANFKRIEAILPVRLAIFDELEIDPRNPSSHWVLWHRAAAAATRDHEIIFFVIPDMLYATGTMLHWAGFFERGYRAVCAAGPQVVLETTLEEIEAQFPPASPAPIALDVPAIHRLQIRQMHPLMVCMLRDSGRWPRHPDTILAAVPGQGLVMRILASQPFCIDLDHFAVTDAFCPVDHLEAIAFDQPRTVCLEPMLKHTDFHYRAATLDETRLSNLGSWVDYFPGSPADILWTYQNARLYWRGAAEEMSFRRAEAALGFLACQVRLTGAIYRVLRALPGCGCSLAAQLGAAAHYVGRLRRHWRIKAAFTILVPDDAALTALGSDAIGALVAEGNEPLLIEAIMAHVVPGVLILRPGDEVSSAASEGSATAVTGDRFHVVSPQAKVAGGPIEVDDCTIYVIDRPLSRWPLRPECESRSVLPNRWSTHPERMPSVAPAEPTRSPAGPAPARTPTPAMPPRSMACLLKRLLRAGLHRGYGIASALPVMRRAAAMAFSLYEARVRRRRVAAAHLAAAAADWAVAAPMPPSSSPAATAFGLCQSARVVLNLAAILCFHRDTMGELGTKFPPLKRVEDCLAAAGLTEQRVVGELQRIVAEVPDFAEAWLELGFVHLGQRNAGQAETCFDRSLAGRALVPTTAGRIGGLALAAFGKAQALEAQGRLDAAAEAYRGAFGRGYYPPMMRLAYARLLRRLGRYREALVEWNAGLETDLTAIMLPPMPRDFTVLAEQLATTFGREHDVPPVVAVAG